MRTLTLYSAELRDTAATDEMILSLPVVSRDKVKSRQNRGETALGELLRIHMMRVCGVADGAVARGIHGKPYVPGRCDISFSISHSKGFATGALLVSSAGEAGDVGIDVEYIDRGKRERCERIAERFFTPSEREQIHASPDPVSEFYLTWTRKEAYLKYTGEGITRPLLSVDTTALDAALMCRVIRGINGGEYALSVSFGSEFTDIDINDIEKIY